MTILSDDEPATLDEGTALCLSGGGYRAMLFHCGSLMRLNELGVLKNLKRVSSVSGGSITAGLLGLRWRELDFGPDGVAASLGAKVIEPLLAFSAHNIDVGAIAAGMVPFVEAADRVEHAYRELLFGDATLQDLPSDDEGPRFVINATNVQSGVLFRFSKPYAGDYLVGRIDEPTFAIAQAVTASSAFPPFLSPMVLDVGEVSWLEGDPAYIHLRKKLFLSDGGVYDNLGLETAYKRHRRLLVSDGGQRIEADEHPQRDWARHSKRIFDLVDSQVRSLRKRMLLGAFESGERSGAYFGMKTAATAFSAPPFLEIDPARARQLAETPTRLSRLDPVWATRLINYGYALSDLAYRSHVDPTAPVPTRLPYPNSGI